jgi:integrase/recombinase XerD
MTTIRSTTTAVQSPFEDAGFDEAQLAAASFVACYSGRTLEAYRHDLGGFFQWAADHDVPVLGATRPHIELWRGSMEERGLAASTIDRRLSTVCGFYRLGHIDGRIGSNPAEYVRRPQVHPSDARGLDRSELGMFLAAADHYDSLHQALAVLLGLNGCESAKRARPTSRTWPLSEATGSFASPARATRRPPSRSSHVRPARSTWRSANATKARSCDGGTASGSTVAMRTGGCVRSASAPDSATSTRTCFGRPSSCPPSTPACLSGTCRPPPGTPTREPRRSTTVVARNFDRHAAYVVVAFVAGG